MGKIAIRLSTVIILILIVVFTFVITRSVAAHHSSRVLGTSTSIPQIPPTTEGPGLILPDSPFFFLDNLKQNVRLFLAFAPEQKAKVYSDIAGERLAELRFMLAKNNKEGVRTALQGVSDNLGKAADSVTQAQLSGRDVSKLAQKINMDIKTRQETLDLLEAQSRGEMAAQVKVAGESLIEAKIKVEDALPAEELENEIRDDLNRKAERRVIQASNSVKELEADLAELNRQATEAAKNSLKAREDALKKAIEQKNEVLKREEERLLEAERKKQNKLLQVQTQAAIQAQAAIETAQKAALRFQQTQQEVNQIRNQVAPTVVPITPTPFLAE